MLGSDAIAGSVVAALFRPSFVRSVHARRMRSSLRALGLHRVAAQFASIGALWSEAYRDLEQSYRCEYVVKNELIEKFVDDSCAVFTELPIAFSGSRVDLVICRDTTIAFEVKSELDRFDRLERQLMHNSKLFDLNYVVCTNGAVGELHKALTGTSIGIVVNDRDGISIAKRARNNARRVIPDAIFGTLRHEEALLILNANGVPPAEVPAAYRFDAYREAFSRLSPSQAHEGFVRILRDRTYGLGSRPLEDLPRALKHMFLQSKEPERKRLLEPGFLARPVG